MKIGQTKQERLFLLLNAALICLVYYPGINGPFVFDDFGSILDNSYIQIQNLDLRTLYHSSFSVAAGPLNRPIANLSFALNFYFGNGIADADAYKLTNIAIHIIASTLIFYFSRLLLNKHVNSTQNNGHNKTSINTTLIAGLITVIWSTHPLNLTSVLYVVQRMTSLSGLFSIATIILYICARNIGFKEKINAKTIMFSLSAIVTSLCALFSKENAILLPLFILLIELAFYGREKPWSSIKLLDNKHLRLLQALLILAFLAFTIYAFNYASNGYGSRTFTLIERLLTESRVLCFYLGLIILPRIDQFGLYHDDIPISTSLLEPWTTIPSVFFIITLVVFALAYRKKLPLTCFGISWFLIGHLLESTIFALEIAHEHRNYLPSYGIIFAAICLPIDIKNKFDSKKVIIFASIFIFISSGTTWLRSSEWSDYTTLAIFEGTHHPESASAQSILSNAYYRNGDYEKAKNTILKAAENNPLDPSSLISAYMLWSLTGVELPDDTNVKIVRLLKETPPSASSQIVLTFIGKCISTSCKRLQPYMENWLHVIIENTPNPLSKSVYQHLLGQTYRGQGRILDALNAFQSAHNNDSLYAHPLFEMAGIFITLGQIENAEFAADKIREINKKGPHPRDKELERVMGLIESLKKQVQSDGKIIQAK